MEKIEGLKDSRGKIMCLVGQLGNGGTEKQLLLFLSNLPRDAYEPLVVVSSDTYLGSRREREISDGLGIKVKYLHGPRPVKILHYLHILLNFRPDAVLSWSFYVNGFCGTTPFCPFIGALRGSLEVAKEQLSPAHFASCLRPAKIIANSELLGKQLVESGRKEDSVFVIPNIFERKYSLLDRDRFAACRNAIRSGRGIDCDETIVAGGGRNTPEKDLGFFVEVIGMLSRGKRARKYRGLLVGDCVRELSGKIRDQGLREFFHFCDEKENAHDIFPAADIFFLSSRSEGMPNMLIEAIDSLCLPVAMDVGGVADLLGGGCGEIISERRADLAADRIAILYESEEMRQKVMKDALGSLDRLQGASIVRNFIGAMGI